MERRTLRYEIDVDSCLVLSDGIDSCKPEPPGEISSDIVEFPWKRLESGREQLNDVVTPVLENDKYLHLLASEPGEPVVQGPSCSLFMCSKLQRTQLLHPTETSNLEWITCKEEPVSDDSVDCSVKIEPPDMVSAEPVAETALHACQRCDAVFDSELHLNVHHTYAHQCDDTEWRRCSKCCLYFSSRENLSKHEATAHRMDSDRIAENCLAASCSPKDVPRKKRRENSGHTIGSNGCRLAAVANVSRGAPRDGRGKIDVATTESSVTSVWTRGHPLTSSLKVPYVRLTRLSDNFIENCRNLSERGRQNSSRLQSCVAITLDNDNGVVDNQRPINRPDPQSPSQQQQQQQQQLVEEQLHTSANSGTATTVSCVVNQTSDQSSVALVESSAQSTTTTPSSSSTAPNVVGSCRKATGSTHKFTCERCSITYDSLEAVLNHVKLTHKLDASQHPMTCKNCRQNFRSVQLLKSHILAEHSTGVGDQPKSHNTRRSRADSGHRPGVIGRQQQLVQRTLPVALSSCFAKPQNFVGKMKLANGKVASIQCVFCRQDFQSTDQLLCHVIDRHPVNCEAVVYKCIACSRQFKELKDFVGHECCPLIPEVAGDACNRGSSARLDATVTSTAAAVAPSTHEHTKRLLQPRIANVDDTLPAQPAVVGVDTAEVADVTPGKETAAKVADVTSTSLTATSTTGLTQALMTETTRDECEKVTEAKATTTCMKSDGCLGLHQSLYRLQQDWHLCDTTLVADDGSVEVHASVVAASSELLKTFLVDNWSPTNFRRIVIPGMQLTLLRAIVRFMYTGQFLLDPRECAGIDISYEAVDSVFRRLGLKLPTELESDQMDIPSSDQRLVDQTSTRVLTGKEPSRTR